MQEKRRCWLKGRRELFFKDLVKDFIHAFNQFKLLEEKFSPLTLHYPLLQELVGTEARKGILWILKDNSHCLWKDASPEDDPHAFFFDWMAGTIFHEAMKLKENIYLVEKYRPSMERALELGINTSYWQRCGVFIKAATQDIAGGMERLECLFDQASEQLRLLIVKHRENALLLRFILERQDLVNQVWKDKGGARGILQLMFPEGLDQAYCTVGESYLEGSWYAQAREAFARALEINPHCIEARSGLRLLEKRINEVASTLAREYGSHKPGMFIRSCVFKERLDGRAEGRSPSLALKSLPSVMQ